MPLHRVITVKKDGTRTDEIVWNENTTTSYKPVKEVVSRLVQCFKYEVKTDINPSLIIS